LGVATLVTTEEVDRRWRALVGAEEELLAGPRGAPNQTRGSVEELLLPREEARGRLAVPSAAPAEHAGDAILVVSGSGRNVPPRTRSVKRTEVVPSVFSGPRGPAFQLFED